MGIEQSIVYTFNDRACCVCGTRMGVKLQHMSTAYHTELEFDHPENPNNCFACDRCMEEVIDPYWADLWAEYYASRL